MQKINSTDEALKAETVTHMQTQNPAEAIGAPRPPRVPMTAPTRKLEIAELPGWWLQWIRGTPDRMAQARNAYFEHVFEHELHVNNLDVGGDAKTSGNTDMGTIVSTGDGGGEIGRDGQPIRLFLMKQRKEYHDEDVAFGQTRNDAVVESLAVNFRKGTVGLGAEGAPAETPQDQAQRYVGKDLKTPRLFQRKTSRS